MTIKLKLAGAAGFALVALLPAQSLAHFILQAPASAIVENKLGDPQKAAPCGIGEGVESTPTGAVTAAVGGSMLHIKVQETVYHPGHYRIALAVLDRGELPADPQATTRDTERGPYSVAGKIDPAPRAPVLVDGLWVHHEKPAAGAAVFHETDVKLPNINCESCTLQVLQFMEEHGLNKMGEFSYHHCATLKITADPKLKRDTGWPGQNRRASR